MNDVPAGLFESIKGAPWPAWIVASAVLLWVMVRQLRQFKVEDANNEAKVGAIDIYKEMSKDLRDALDEMTKRADDFAKERNEMATSVAEMRGQVKEMTRNIEVSTTQFNQLMDLLKTQGEHLKSQGDNISKLVSLIEQRGGA